MLNQSRSFRPFALKYPVTIADPADPDRLITSEIFFVVNLEKTFYSCERLRNILGFWPGSLVDAMESQISVIRINNATELSKMGALGELNVTLKPVNPGQIWPSLGLIHKTSFYFVLSKPLQTVARDLRGVHIRIAESNIEYEVVPGSISLKKRKKTTPHLG